MQKKLTDIVKCKYKLELYFLSRIATIKATETIVVKYLIPVATQMLFLNIYVHTM